MKQILIYLSVIFIIIISGTAFIISRKASRAMGQISQEEFQERLKAGWKVIDVRTPEEYSAGHIEEAMLIDYYKPDFKDKIGELDKSGKYLLYCRTGVRSSKARGIMESMGFENVSDLAGGYAGWVRN